MSVDTALNTVSAEDVFHQVRRQLRREKVLPSRNGAVRFYSGVVVDSASAIQPVTGSGSEEVIQRLQRLYATLGTAFDADAHKIGGMPPIAGGVRGKLGHVTICIVRRFLWWYTLSLHQFAESIGVRMQVSAAAIESMAVAHEEARLEIAELREEVRVLRESLERVKDERR